MIRSRADDNCNDGDYTRDECCINNAQLLVLFDWSGGYIWGGFYLVKFSRNRKTDMQHKTDRCTTLYAWRSTNKTAKNAYKASSYSI